MRARPQRRPARALLGKGRGGGGGRRGRDRSRRSRRPGRSRADTARDAAVCRSSAAWLGASAGSAAAAARRGHRSATRDARATARPSEPPPGLPERRPDAPAARTLGQVRSHLLRARAQDTMRSALLLSAFLLSLLLSVNGNVTGTTDGQSSTVKTTTQSVVSIIASDQTLNSTPDKQSAALTSTETSTVTTAPASTVVSTSAQQSPTASATETTPVTTGAPAATSTTVSTSPESTSSRNAMNDSPTSRIPTTHSVATDSVAAKEGSQKIATSPHPNIIPSISPVLSSSTNLSSTQQPSPGPVTLAPGTSEPTGSFPEGSDKMTVTTSLGRMTSPTFTAQVTTLKTQVAVEGTQHASSETPAATVATGVQQPTGSSQGRGTTSLVRRSTISSTQLTSNAPQSSSTPSPTSVIPTNIGQIQCHPPEKLNESKLSLNISGANSCNTVASNHRLVEVLCQAVKSSFNKTQDECYIEMAPGSHAQEVDIKQITIITKLQPADIYKLLKDDWDKLEDVGVRDMQFGGQGPPEEMEDRFSMPLIITIVCMASFLLLVAALYGCCHQRLSHRKDQQRLTEELQTVENGYHDNPTLEVMETSSEMQEKKVANLNGELGDSWIVPLDNLTKDDPEEEDTHL
ncbi:podocalyxin [Bubalus kerabau]|uniref:podocalyxin n=1 Tax=Bubalus carabanensis TaxID=3119969 RepID=UPI00244EA61F|nr:podocalyxin [Bubalus carabanensis]